MIAARPPIPRDSLPTLSSPLPCFDDADTANTHRPDDSYDDDIHDVPFRTQPYQLLRAVWTLVPSFAGNQQQDAHEFTRFLLERLRSEFVRGDAEPERGREGPAPPARHAARPRARGGWRRDA